MNADTVQTVKDALDAHWWLSGAVAFALLFALRLVWKWLTLPCALGRIADALETLVQQRKETQKTPEAVPRVQHAPGYRHKKVF